MKKRSSCSAASHQRSALGLPFAARASLLLSLQHSPMQLYSPSSQHSHVRLDAHVCLCSLWLALSASGQQLTASQRFAGKIWVQRSGFGVPILLKRQVAARYAEWWCRFVLRRCITQNYMQKMTQRCCILSNVSFNAIRGCVGPWRRSSTLSGASYNITGFVIDS